MAGLYGLLLPVIAYGVLGSSRVLMTGPTATAALMVGPALVAVSADPATYPALAAMLALLVAATFLVARVLRLGWISDYFSSAVLLGFLTGLALTLVSGQLGAFFGVEVEGDTSLQEYQSFASNVLGRGRCAHGRDRARVPGRSAGRRSLGGRGSPPCWSSRSPPSPCPPGPTSARRA